VWRVVCPQLWRKLVPKETPLADDVDFDALANKYEFVGSSIHTAIFKAASYAAMRDNEADRIVKMKDLVAAAEDEAKRQRRLTSSDMSDLPMYL